MVRFSGPLLAAACLPLLSGCPNRNALSTEQLAEASPQGSPETPAGAIHSGPVANPMELTHQRPVASFTFTPDGKRLISVDTEGTVYFWDRASGKEIRQVALKKKNDDLGHSGYVLSPSGQYLGVSGFRPAFRFVEVATGREIWSGDAPRIFHEPAIFAPDEKLLVVSDSPNARVWDTVTGKETRSFQWPEGHGHHLALSPDGKILALASDSFDRQNSYPFYEISLQDVETGKEVRRLKKPIDDCRTLAFCANGRVLAVVGIRGVQLWNIASGQQLGLVNLKDHGAFVTVMVGSPDGRTLAIAQHNRDANVNTIEVIEVASQGVRQEFRAHQGMIKSLAFSPDSNVLAAGSEEKMIPRTPLGIPVPDRNVVAAGSEEKIVRFWDLTVLPDMKAAEASLAAPQIEALWSDLAASNARQAYQAILRLIASPRETVPFLKTHLQPVPTQATTAQEIGRLIIALDHDELTMREQATRALGELGKAAEPALRQALAGKPSAEVRRRVEQLLDDLQGSGPSLDLRQGRAAEVLEKIGSPESQQLLAALAQGKPEALLTREAQAALGRLTRKTGTRP